jgi:serine/threonine-protein kinase
VRSILELPPGTTLASAHLDLARDGLRLVVSGERDGTNALLVRSLDEFEFRWVAGTEGAQRFSISPDGQWFGFASQGELRIVAASGGTAQALAAAFWGGCDWTSGGDLIYTPSYQDGLWSASRSGGTARQLTAPDRERGELGHFWPQILPDGEHVLFTAFSTPIERARIEVLSLVSGERKVLVEGGSMARYVATGHLLFGRKGALFAMTFDVDRLEERGTAVPVVEGIATISQDGYMAYSVAENGSLAYLPAADFEVPIEFEWVDRRGQSLGKVAPAGLYSDAALSPDGRWLAASFQNPAETRDVVLFDLERGTRSSLTSGGAGDFQPLFSPGSDRVVFSSERPVFDLYVRPADGSVPAAPLVVTKADKFPGSVTAEGTLLFTHGLVPHSQIWSIPLDGSKEPEVVLASDQFDLSLPTISPDGRWLAYRSSEGERGAVYVVPYPRRPPSAHHGFGQRWERTALDARREGTRGSRGLARTGHRLRPRDWRARILGVPLRRGVGRHRQEGVCRDGRRRTIRRLAPPSELEAASRHARDELVRGAAREGPAVMFSANDVRVRTALMR